MMLLGLLPTHQHAKQARLQSMKWRSPPITSAGADSYTHFLICDGRNHTNELVSLFNTHTRAPSGESVQWNNSKHRWCLHIQRKTGHHSCLKAHKVACQTSCSYSSAMSDGPALYTPSKSGLLPP